MQKEEVTEAELLNYIKENDKIKLDEIRIEYEMKKYEELLSKHSYDIWRGKNGKWYTYFPDEEKGRVLKKRNTREEIEDLIIAFYKEKEENPTVEEVFRLWLSKKLEYKEIQKGSADRYETDFERFLVKTNFSKRRMKQIAADELEDFIRLQVAQNELTMKAYSGLRTIIRGTWMFAKKKKWTDISISQFFGDLDIAVYADLKLYMGEKYLPSVFSCKDTISWQSYGETENRTLDRFPSFQNCLIDATNHSGYQVSKKFYPYIDNADRFYFVTPYPLMKEANSYWNRGNYEEASYLWEYVYENAEKMGRKAKAAANMALYEELNDRYDSALDWVKKSLNIFLESPEKYSNYIEYLLEYQQQLNVRIQENRQMAF